MTAFVAVMLPLVVTLGFWQLQRGEEKRGYETRYYDRVGMLPTAPPAELEDAAFLRFRLHGSYLAGRTYLVDNRVRDGRPGYWVVTPLVAADGRRWLVNRGFVAAPALRAELPEIITPQGPVTLVGVVWPDTGQLPLLADDPWASSWPRRIQRLDVPRLAAVENAEPVEVRLEPGAPGVYAAAPVDADFAPERHDGYAVQWFALGAALVICYLLFGLRRS
jgi:surfeit locus 1 family protein